MKLLSFRILGLLSLLFTILQEDVKAVGQIVNLEASESLNKPASVYPNNESSPERSQDSNKTSNLSYAPVVTRDSALEEYSNNVSPDVLSPIFSSPAEHFVTTPESRFYQVSHDGLQALAFTADKHPSNRTESLVNQISQADPSQERFPEGDIPPGPIDVPLQQEVDEPPRDENLPANVEASETFQVNRIEITGSTVFSEEDLRDIVLKSLLAPSPEETVDSNILEDGLTITREQQQTSLDAITKQYVNEGYITSRATISEPSIDDGVLRIQIIEGFLEEINIEGTERLQDYVHSRIALVGDAPFNAGELEGQLRLLRNSQLFDEVNGDLSRGNQPNGSILTVTVEEANSFQGSIGLDTVSPLSVGRYRSRATLSYLNPLGLGDRLSATANITTTGGSKSYELAYQVPFNPMDGNVLFRFAPNDFRITNVGATGGIRSSGSSDIYEVVVRQPFIRNFNEEAALSLGFRHRDGSSVVAGIVTPPIKTSVFSFGQDYLRRDRRGAWVLRSQFRLGTELFDATTRPDPQPDGQFFLWAGQAQRVQRLSQKHLLIIQADAQLTGNNLVGSEQFFIGGPNSVRGYFQNQRFGDNGVRVSLADYITLSKDKENRPTIQLVPFIDAAYAWFNNEQAQDRLGQDNFLLGTGLGLVVNPVEGLNASVDVGVPLVSTDGSPDILVDFNVRYGF